MIWEKFKDGTYSTTDGNIFIELSEKECIITKDTIVKTLECELSPDIETGEYNTLDFIDWSKVYDGAEFSYYFKEVSDEENLKGIFEAVEKYARGL